MPRNVNFSYNLLKHPHTQPLCEEDFLDLTGPSIAFLMSAGLLDQSWRRATQQQQQQQQQMRKI